MKITFQKLTQFVSISFPLRGVLIFITTFVFFAGNALAKPAGCSCSPCTCSPCTCGGGHHDRARVGVGVNVDLGGVGHRKTEADPFAVSGGSTTAQTHEKSKTKKKEASGTKDNPFTDVKLTGNQAKDVAASANSSTTATKP
jgi:hypothetical protein